MSLATPLRSAATSSVPLSDRAVGLTATCFGVRVDVRVDEPGLLPKIRERLPPGSRVSPFGPDTGQSDPGDGCLHSYRVRLEAGAAVAGVSRYSLGYVAEAPFLRAGRESEVLSAFESAVRLDVAVATSAWSFVHAGVVGWNGRAVVIPAPSRHGKSRLVEALLAAGAVYYSDEFAVLDERGRVHPYAKPLTLRKDDGGERRVPVAELDGPVGVTPLRIGTVVCTRYEPDHAWRPRRAAAGEGVLTMLANTVGARLAPGLTLRRLARAVEGAAVLEGPRGEAEAVVRDLPRWFHAAQTDKPRSGGHDAP